MPGPPATAFNSAGTSGDFAPGPFHHAWNDASGSAAGLPSPASETASQYAIPPYSWSETDGTDCPSLSPKSAAVAASLPHSPGFGSGPFRSPIPPPV